MATFRSKLPRATQWCCRPNMPVAVTSALFARPREPPRPLFPVDLPFGFGTGPDAGPAPPCKPAIVPIVIGDYPPDRVVRPGDILANPSGWLPPGYLVCDGSEVKIADFPTLYRILGDYYSNEGDAARGVFHLPKVDNLERPNVMHMIKYDLWDHPFCPPGPPCTGEPMPAPPATMSLQILPYPTPFTPPPGTILQTTVNYIPYGYLLCDGREVSRTQYALLHSVVGYFYGEQPPDSTVFYLPNLTNYANPDIKYIIRYDVPENIVIEVNPNMVMNNMSLSGAGSIEIV